MRVKRIIIPLITAAVIGAGVGSYCYTTVKASTLFSNGGETISSSNSSENSATLNSPNSIVSSTTKNGATSNTENATSGNTAGTNNSKVANTINSNNSSSTKVITLNSETSTPKTNVTNVSDTTNTQQTNNSSNVKEINKYEYIASDATRVSIMETSSLNSTLGTVPGGSKVYVYSESNGCYYINYQGIKGYVQIADVQAKKISYKQIINKNIGNEVLVHKTGYIPSFFNDGVIVEWSPNDIFGEVDRLYAGDSFYVETEGDGWAHIKIGSQYGYIKTSQITYTTPETNIDNTYNGTTSS